MPETGGAGSDGGGYTADAKMPRQPSKRCLLIWLAVVVLIMTSLAIAIIVLLATGRVSRAHPTYTQEAKQASLHLGKPSRPENSAAQRRPDSSDPDAVTSQPRTAARAMPGHAATTAAKLKARSDLPNDQKRPESSTEAEPVGNVSAAASGQPPSAAAAAASHPAEKDGSGQLQASAAAAAAAAPSSRHTSLPVFFSSFAGLIKRILSPHIGPPGDVETTHAPTEAASQAASVQTEAKPNRTDNGTAESARSHTRERQVHSSRSTSFSVNGGPPVVNTVEETVVNGKGVRHITTMGPDGRPVTRTETFAAPPGGGAAAVASHLPPPPPPLPPLEFPTMPAFPAFPSFPAGTIDAAAATQHEAQNNIERTRKRIEQMQRSIFRMAHGPFFPHF